MPQRRLLFLDANLMSAYRWQDGQLYPEGSFATDSKGQEAFATYLPEHKKSLFYLLAEVVEEGFQADVIPHVQGSDRTALLKRKVDQYFFGTTLNLAFTMGRETEGRRDDKILFYALTRPQFFEPWLDALRAAECQLTGVYSVSLIANTLVSLLSSKTPRESPRFLLVSLSRGGLRQSFFEQGKLRFSRLTPLLSDSAEEIADACALESTRIHQYLIGQRLVERGAALPAMVLTHPSQIQTFRARCPDSNDLRFEFIDLVAEGRRLKLKTVPQDSRSEALFLHLMARKTPTQQFAQAAERRLFRLWQTKLVLNSMSLVIFLSCMIFSGRQLIQTFQLSENTSEVQQQAQALAQRYEAALKTLPQMPFSSSNLRALIEGYDNLVKRSATLDPMYQRISEALQQSARVELDRLDWKVLRDPEEGLPSSGGPGKPPVPALGGSKSDLFVVIDIYAQLPVTLKNDERTLKTIIEAFSASLTKDGKVQARILKLPFDVESTKALRSTDDSATVVEAPRFSLRLSQKL
ncbi:MAG: hypothetical protein HY847_10675 [Betaproteobacteria bacterium]|nr:hypothetical protein [Betaproteobacteria bacterium]